MFDSIPWLAVRAVGSGIAIAGALALTIARPWVRERNYSLLRGDAGRHRSFVLDAVQDKESRDAVAGLIMDTIADPRYAARHREIHAQQWREEIAANRECRQLMADRGRVLDQVLEQNEHLRNLAESTATSTRQLTQSTESLVSATERLVNTTDEIARKTQDVAERVARLEGAK